MRTGFKEAEQNTARRKPDLHQHCEQPGLKTPRRSVFCFRDVISGEQSWNFSDKECPAQQRQASRAFWELIWIRGFGRESSALAAVIKSGEDIA